MKAKQHTLIVLLVFVLSAGAALTLLTHANQKRSEERRVGKECRIGCRSRWSPYH